MIKELFARGSYFNFHPIKVIYLQQPDLKNPHKALFTVSVRLFKKAVDRNRIKRRIRESYRLKKSSLKESPKLLVGFIYTSPQVLPYAIIEKAMTRAIEKLNRLESSTAKQ